MLQPTIDHELKFPNSLSFPFSFFPLPLPLFQGHQLYSILHIQGVMTTIHNVHPMANKGGGKTYTKVQHLQRLSAEGPENHSRIRAASRFFYAKITKCLLKLASPESLNLLVTPENEQPLARVQQLELHLQFSMPWWLDTQPSLHFPSETAPSDA